MAKSSESAAFLAARPPAVPLAEVARVVEAGFGLRGKYDRLVSERDQNYHLTSDDDNEYVVKVSNSTEVATITDQQVALLLHLEQFSSIPTPIVQRTCSSDCRIILDYAGESFSLRVVSYLAGVPLASIPLSEKIAADFGAGLAQLDQVLQSFPSKGENPYSLWDLQQAAELRNLQQYIDDPSVRSDVEAVLDRFDTVIATRLQKLPKQAIHGDANPENVLVDATGQRVTGFIDFGDIVFAPRIVDVAIAASYLRAAAPQPLRFIEPFVAAYQSRAHLEADEVDLLYDLVRTRLATTITMLYWRMSERDQDDPYRQKTLQTERGAIDFLRAIKNA